MRIQPKLAQHLGLVDNPVSHQQRNSGFAANGVTTGSSPVPASRNHRRKVDVAEWGGQSELDPAATAAVAQYGIDCDERLSRASGSIRHVRRCCLPGRHRALGSPASDQSLDSRTGRRRPGGRDATAGLSQRIALVKQVDRSMPHRCVDRRAGDARATFRLRIGEVGIGGLVSRR